MSDLFSDLPWFLQEYIHENRWETFRSIQLETYRLFVRGKEHILISAGTSSGKTEAAMFPVIASLYNDPPATFGALYVGPLKALIDDQFERISPILRESGLRITGWHGDVGQSSKKKALKDPSGILQITPESLQNIVSNHPEELPRLFSDLRFVIIDEVHTFMGSDRGLQLLCCLERIERATGCRPRRLGLSATISDLTSACDWLSAGTGISTAAVSDNAVGERVVEVRYNLFPTEKEEEGLARKRALTRYYKELYADVRGKSCIVFTNSRDSAEKTSRSLNKMAELDGRPGEVFIHHGSVSKELRRNAETALKNKERKVTVVATVTLELGIDVGNLDRIVQIGAPYTCSSFVQRMGRSGRRGGRQNMVVYCNEDLTKYWTAVDGIPFDLVKCIAIAELVLRDGWVESPYIPRLPYGLLYHQTLEYIKSGIGVKFEELVSEVLSLYPFRHITRKDYRTLMVHLIRKGELQTMEDGTILLGEQGERMAFGRDFCSVFTTGKEFEIKFNGKSIGSIQQVPRIGDLVQLAGRVWEVVDISIEDYHADVVESDGTVNTLWSSGTPGMDTRVLRKMKEVLISSEDYPYLDDDARTCLGLCRSKAYDEGLDSVFVRKEHGFRLYPWLGSRQFDTLERILSQIDDVKGIRCRQPYYIDLVTDLSENEIRSEIERYQSNMENVSLVVESDDLRIGKFDAHVPEELLIKQFAADEIDLDFEI